uniref:ARAD1B12320p n=1 Tax=Blastobotrys adeninivorans TaxID=409370 RepID=A0A060T5K2_BLAAD
MSQMKAVRVVSTNAEVREEPVPTPGRRQVLIKVHAASLNYRDMLLLKGAYPIQTKKDVVPLSDGAGEVVAVGEDVSRVKKGDRVSIGCTNWVGGSFLPEYRETSVGFSVDGTLAEYAVFEEDSLVHIPDYLSYVEAASLPCAAVTAWAALNKINPLQAGQTVLVQGTGGVALFALQFAKLFGARVLAITSSDEKAAKLKELGAEAVINYSTTPDWEKEILALTDGQGVDRVIEIAGEKTIKKSAAATKVTGVIVVIGFASGVGGGLTPMEILMRSITVTGSMIGPRVDFEAMLKGMEVAKLRPVVDSVYPFAEYNEAFKRLESGQQVGKVVIEIAK